MSIPHDVTRCNGEHCLIRSNCLRFIYRNDTGPRTPFFHRLPDRDGPCPLYKASPEQGVVTTDPRSL